MSIQIKPDVKKSHCGLESVAGPLTESAQPERTQKIPINCLPKGRTPQYETIRHVKAVTQDAGFVENVVII
ncbi:unnamed protein product [Hymenolepis diminuta]|uniref:Kinesin motor domain-containing protein n=1 Tax=Hymenolepis diminuta TaxID=6216 RepID=A0A0R3SY07_HYMDI|nr:unnamed protein product [Hymenolepis diminuta]